MKKFFICFSYLFILFFIYSEDFISEYLGFKTNVNTPRYCLRIKNDKIELLKNDFDWHGDITIFGDSSNEENLIINSDGYPEVDIWGTEMVLLAGGGRVIFIDKNIDWKNPNVLSRNFSDSVKLKYIDELTNVWPAQMITFCLEDYQVSMVNNGVKLSCNSNLVDKNKKYNIKNIEKNFLTYIEYPMNKQKYSYMYNSTLVPRAEAEKGSGIGVSIDIKFVPNEYSKPEEEKLGKCKSFVVINGYVDFFRMDLFRKNNRVKRVFVESIDDDEKFSFEYVLKDTPNFQEINLPRYTKKIKMTILDIYKGSLYDDTCLSGIMTSGVNNLELEEKDRHILAKNEDFISYTQMKEIKTCPVGY